MKKIFTNSKMFFYTILLTFSLNSFADDLQGFEMPTNEDVLSHNNKEFIDKVSKHINKVGYQSNIIISGSYKLNKGESEQFEMLPLEQYLLAITGKMTISNNYISQKNQQIDWGFFPVAIICEDNVFIFEARNPETTKNIIKNENLKKCKFPNPNSLN